ncbi:unnamed protein product [Polarella glacialis]|uniref:Uncharacterized protein n=1 Tax=Polarella glacialis TaxID=89957 RepID=A0A813FFD7_POLGL|nr:unnamed protein product [Polarella glacialis]
MAVGSLLLVAVAKGSIAGSVLGILAGIAQAIYGRQSKGFQKEIRGNGVWEATKPLAQGAPVPPLWEEELQASGEAEASFRRTFSFPEAEVLPDEETCATGLFAQPALGGPALSRELPASSFVELLGRLAAEAAALRRGGGASASAPASASWGRGLAVPSLYQESRAATVVMDELACFAGPGGPLVVEEFQFAPGRTNLKVTYPGSSEASTCTVGFIGAHFDVSDAAASLPEGSSSATLCQPCWSSSTPSLVQQGDNLVGPGLGEGLSHVALLTVLLCELARAQPKLQRSVVVIFLAARVTGEGELGADELLRRGALSSLQHGPVFWLDAGAAAAADDWQTEPQICAGSLSSLGWTLRTREAPEPAFPSSFGDPNSIEIASEAVSYIQNAFDTAFSAHPEEAACGFACGSMLKPTRVECLRTSGRSCPETLVHGLIRLTPFHDLEAAMTSVEGFVADFNALSGGLSAAAASTLRSSGRPGSSRRTEANSSSGEFQAEMQDEEDYGDEECEGNSSPSAAARRTQREIRIRSRRSSRPQPTGAEASIGRPLMPGSEASLGLLSSGRASVELLWAERTNSQPASPHLSLPEQVRLTLRMRARGAGMAWPYNPVSTNRGATASAGTTRRPTGRSETASKRTQGAMDLARDLEGTATSSCSLGRVALEEALRVPVQDSLPPTPSAALPLQRLRVFSVNGSVPHARRLLDAGFDIQLLGFTRRPSCTVNISSSSEAPAASVASPAVPASTKALQTSSKATSTVSADATTAAPAARSGSFKAAADRADLVQQQSPRQQQKLQPLRDQQKLGNSEELCDAERCSLEGMRRGYEVLLRLIQLLEPSYEVPTVSGASFFEPRPELRGEAEASIDSFGTIAACTDEVPAALDLATTSFDLDAAIGPLPGEAPEEQRDPVALPGCGRSFSADALRRGEDIDVAAPSAAELDELPPTPTRSHASNRAEEGAEESHGSSASGWFTWIPRLPVFMR